VVCGVEVCVDVAESDELLEIDPSPKKLVESSLFSDDESADEVVTAESVDVTACAPPGWAARATRPNAAKASAEPQPTTMRVSRTRRRLRSRRECFCMASGCRPFLSVS
jgi:hypothetical protein